MSTPSSAFGSKPSEASPVPKPRRCSWRPKRPIRSSEAGPIRAASVLEYLAQRFSVHGIFFREPGAPDPAAGAFLAGRVGSRGSCRSAISFQASARARPAQCHRAWPAIAPPLVDRFSGFEAQIERCLSRPAYEAAFIEHFWCAPYVDQVRPSAQRVILDLYNIESAWHRQHGVVRERIAGVEPPAIRARALGSGALLAAQIRSHSGHFAPTMQTCCRPLPGHAE